MKNIKTLLLASTLLGLAACTPKSQDNNDKDLKPRGIPETIEFQKPTPGAKLTKEEVMILKRELTIRSEMELPPMDLVFPNVDEPKSELIQKEKALYRRDKNAYYLLKDIQNSKCSKARPTLKVDASLPLDGIGIEEALSNIQTGDHATATATAAMSGSSCPVEIDLGFSEGIEIKEKAEKSISAQAGISGRYGVEVKDPNYIQKLGARGIKFDTSISAAAMTKDLKTGRGLLEFSFGGQLLTIKSNVPFLVNVKALLKSETSAEIAVRFKIDLNNITADLMVFAVQQGQDVLRKDLYLNGNPTTEQELNDLFGNSTIQRIMDHNNEVIQTMR